MTLVVMLLWCFSVVFLYYYVDYLLYPSFVLMLYYIKYYDLSYVYHKLDYIKKPKIDKLINSIESNKYVDSFIRKD